MANLTETSTWESGIYQLETTDSVEAGAGGISNEQARLLGNRTKWLYDAIAVINTAITSINTWISSTSFLLFLKKGTVAVGDIAGNKVINVTFPTVGTSNYMVNGCLVSLSADYTNDIQCTWIVRSKTAIGFTLIVSEATGFAQNLNFDYTLTPL